MSIFGKKKTPQELAREWTRNLKKEMRQMDRQIRKSQAAKKKLQAEMKKEAKNVNGDKQRLAAVRILAKSVVQQDKQIAHLYGCKAQMNSVVLQIKEQQATIKMTKAMKQSAQVSSLMGRLVRLPQLQGTMMQMQREMQKAGLVQEMIDDTMNDVMGVDDDDVDEEIDKVNYFNLLSRNFAVYHISYIIYLCICTYYVGYYGNNRYEFKGYWSNKW